MDIVVDIQGYRGYHGRFIAKEIAILALKGDFAGHWILQANENLNFPDKYRKEYKWVTTHHHKIDWSTGTTSFRSVTRGTLRDISRSSDRIFVRGSCKAEFIRRFTGREAIDLTEEQDSCPSFRKMVKSDVLCGYHALLNLSHRNQHIHCALTQCHQLRDWINENSSVEAWFDNNV